MTSAYPVPTAELIERVRALAAELGGWPSQRRVMRECKAGAPRAAAALAALRREGFDPTRRPVLTIVPPGAERAADDAETHPVDEETAVPAEAAEADTERPDSAAAPLVSGAAGADAPVRARGLSRWPILVIALGAFVSVWSGWVGLGKLTGFGPVVLLPGIADQWVIDSAITLPLSVEAYAAFALRAWLTGAPVSDRARSFARWSSIGALTLGAAGQIAYHLMAAAGVTVAPWPITAFVATLPVIVLGLAAALAHLLHTGEVAR